MYKMAKSLPLMLKNVCKEEDQELVLEGFARI